MSIILYYLMFGFITSVLFNVSSNSDMTFDEIIFWVCFGPIVMLFLTIWCIVELCEYFVEWFKGFFKDVI